MVREKMTFLELLTKPKTLILISVLFVIIGILMPKGKMFDCKDIFKMHFKCFKKKNTNRYSVYMIFMFFGIPAIITTALIKIRVIDQDVVNIITVIISILTSMLFTLLTLILDMKKSVDNNNKLSSNQTRITGRLLSEVYFSIMFEIIISIIILILCFVELFSKEYTKLSSVLIYYLSLVFLFNLFIILNRTFAVIKEDILTK